MIQRFLEKWRRPQPLWNPLYMRVYKVFGMFCLMSKLNTRKYLTNQQLKVLPCGESFRRMWFWEEAMGEMWGGEGLGRREISRGGWGWGIWEMEERRTSGLLLIWGGKQLTSEMMFNPAAFLDHHYNYMVVLSSQWWSLPIISAVFTHHCLPFFRRRYFFFANLSAFMSVRTKWLSRPLWRPTLLKGEKDLTGPKGKEDQEGDNNLK